MNKLRWLALLMVIAIIGITGFQVYWLKENYVREKQNLDFKTNAAFRQTILKLQASKLKLEQLNLRVENNLPRVRITGESKIKPTKVSWTAKTTTTKEPPITVINLIQEKAREFDNTDSVRGRIFVSGIGDSMPGEIRDSIRKYSGEQTAGTFKRFVISKSLDSIPPEMIKEMHVFPGPRGKNEILVKYDSEDSGRRIQEEMAFRGPMPAGPDMIMPRIAHDSSRNAFVQMIYNIDSLSIKDSVTIREVDSAYSNRLKEEKIQLEFYITKFDSAYGNSKFPNEVTLGLSAPVTYRLSLLHPSRYVLKQLQLPILFSLLLVGITIASFVLLYKNLLKQHRLSQMKNDLISNITHELKTPIATVGVAIEALKNFNAIDDPKRTREYLDISQNELQRLELLVDKVLKLSMFENSQITLQKESFNLEQLVNEVMASMKFQVDKQQATMKFETEGNNFIINADKLHITSVVYNLLDNALKYSGQQAAIEVKIKSYPEYVELKVRDNGIGIPTEYRKRIFDKFFRVPAGNKHNIKGYGLGLSYVDHIVRSHQGFIEVESELDKGSTFVVNIPYGNARKVDFGKERKIFREGFQS